MANPLSRLIANEDERRAPQSALHKLALAPDTTAGRGLQFPTRDDVTRAEDAGVWYGTGMETSPLVTGSGGRRVTAAYLAANRIPVAGLGFDTHRMQDNIPLDQVPPGTDPAMYQGMFDPNEDRIYWQGDAPDTVQTPVHESIHRGFEQMYNAGRDIPGASDENEEEHAVRAMMRLYAGDPEADTIPDDQLEGSRGFETPEGQEKLRRWNAQAAQLVAKRRPGGPR